mgnify:CR=1 FL=1
MVQGISSAMFIADQNRLSIPKNIRYAAPVNVTDNNAAIAERIAVCRIGVKLDKEDFMTCCDSGHRLHSCANQWLISWY